MKHFSVFLLAALFPLIFMGCKSEEDSYPPIHYGYNLAFVDENGNDLIEECKPVLEEMVSLL